jgi:uncharacterized membrane protein
MKLDHPFSQFQKQKEGFRLFSLKTVNLLVSYFFQGLLLVVPITLSIWVLYQAFIYLDNLLPFNLGIGTGFLFLIAGTTLFGFIGSFLITRPFINLLEKLIANVPVLKFLYSTIREFMEAFVGEKKKFTEAVRVQMDESGEIERIGFITAKDLAGLGIPNKVAVYLPFSYQFAGELYLVSSNRIFPIQQPGAEVMKFVVSGGVTELPETHIPEEMDNF